eukprot:m.12794 g.12794  ORF g.12794 m.12794 type:complete len:106 (-) comp4585_c0_seq1:2856-3173(-)
MKSRQCCAFAATAAAALLGSARAQNYIFTCDFVSTSPAFCGMTRTGSWSVNTGATPSTGTGPPAGEGGLTDPYAHIEASTVITGPQCLTIPSFTLGPQGGMLTFS